ncbi:MAG: His/Gly/Thr/Pro-type tRNA ligase C-terminal domain-containing protein, partial [Nitrososphaera sp.]
ALRKNRVLGQVHVPLVYVAYAGDGMRHTALELASTLRNRGIATEYDLLGRPLKKQLDDASSKNAAVAVIVAPQEFSVGTVIIKSLREGKEEKHPVDKLGDVLNSILRA